MKWITFITDLKKLLNIPVKREWFEKLIENIERNKEEGNTIPFRITDIKEKGFVVKVLGLHAYISFNHMPWKYTEFKSWDAVFPRLIDKVFFCKVYSINRNPISIIINGEIPQFKKVELVEHYDYNGIVINKTKYGVFVEIGYHFDWKCGSLVGLLHKSQFDSIEAFNAVETGQEITAKYQGLDKFNHLMFGNNLELIQWHNADFESFISKTQWVKVIESSDGNIDFLVKGKYKAILPITKDIYPMTKNEMKKAKKKLKNGEIIHCEIIGINQRKRHLKLKWNLELENPNQQSSLIENMVDEEIKQKLMLIMDSKELKN